MSRWSEQFEAHQFNQSWGRVKSAIGAATVDDQTVTTNVIEVARLRKVVNYIDKLISAIDPELVPLSTWDNFHTQADACASQIEAYNSSRNIAQIKQANSHADNLLTYVRPYMVNESDSANAMQQSAASYLDTLFEYTNSFQEKSAELLSQIGENKNNSEEILVELNIIKGDVDNLKNKLLDPDTGTKKEIEEVDTEIKNKYDQIIKIFNEVIVGSDEKPSKKVEIKEASDFINSEKERVIQNIKNVEEEITEINDFHLKVFGEGEEEENNKNTISGAFNDLISKLTLFEGNQKIRYEALNKEIENLLPGAASAGLATAYRAMRRSHSKNIVNATRIFYISLGVIFVISIPSVVKSFSINPISVEFFTSGDWYEILVGFFHRLPLYIPALWLAIYSSTRRSEFLRLQQEYAHKAATASSYMSFKNQIDELGDDDKELLKKLINNTIDVVSYNASTTLDGKHGDKMPVQEMLEKSLDIVEKFKGISEKIAKKNVSTSE